MSTKAIKEHMQKHKDQGDLAGLPEYPAPILCEETKLVEATDLFREIFPEFDGEVNEVLDGRDDSDNVWSENLQVNDDIIMSCNHDEKLTDNEEFGQPSLLQMLPGKALGTRNLEFTETDKASTLAYNKSFIGNISRKISAHLR